MTQGRNPQVPAIGATVGFRGNEPDGTPADFSGVIMEAKTGANGSMVGLQIYGYSDLCWVPVSVVTIEHLDFVSVIEVDGRDDGTYVFAHRRDAERFQAAVHTLSAPSDVYSPTHLVETSVNVGDAAERLIAAERGDALEEMGYNAWGNDVREGIPLDKVLAAVTHFHAADATEAVQRWIAEDAKGGES